MPDLEWRDHNGTKVSTRYNGKQQIRYVVTPQGGGLWIAGRCLYAADEDPATHSAFDVSTIGENFIDAACAMSACELQD